MFFLSDQKAITNSLEYLENLIQVNLIFETQLNSIKKVGLLHTFNLILIQKP